MFKENEIAKARYSVLTQTNMLEYACEVYRGIYNTKENPKGLYESVWWCLELAGRIQGIKEKYDDIQDSNIVGCVQDLLEEAASTGSIAKLTEEDLADFEVCIIHSL